MHYAQVGLRIGSEILFLCQNTLCDCRGAVCHQEKMGSGICAGFKKNCPCGNFCRMDGDDRDTATALRWGEPTTLPRGSWGCGMAGLAAACSPREPNSGSPGVSRRLRPAHAIYSQALLPAKVLHSHAMCHHICHCILPFSKHTRGREHCHHLVL